MVKTYSNSYDVFLRGEEIASGSQRINDLDVLIKSAGARGVNLNNVKPYLDSFKYGSWPHAGIGLGLVSVILFCLIFRRSDFVFITTNTA